MLSPVDVSINKLPSMVINPPGTPWPVQSAAIKIAFSPNVLNQ